MNTTIAAGFVLERPAEPYADDQTVRNCPELQDTQVTAHFLHVLCRKPCAQSHAQAC